MPDIEDVKKNLETHVSDAANYIETVITKNGKPVAAIMPIEALKLVDRLEEQMDIEECSPLVDDNL